MTITVDARIISSAHPALHIMNDPSATNIGEVLAAWMSGAALIPNPVMAFAGFDWRSQMLGDRLSAEASHVVAFLLALADGWNLDPSNLIVGGTRQKPLPRMRLLEFSEFTEWAYRLLTRYVFAITSEQVIQGFFRNEWVLNQLVDFLRVIPLQRGFEFVNLPEAQPEVVVEFLERVCRAAFSKDVVTDNPAIGVLQSHFVEILEARGVLKLLRTAAFYPQVLESTVFRWEGVVTLPILDSEMGAADAVDAMINGSDVAAEYILFTLMQQRLHERAHPRPR